MKPTVHNRILQSLCGGLLGLALMAVVVPQTAQASTSGGATIYNTVKVTYQSGSGPVRFATANVSVTVNTVGAAATVRSRSPQGTWRNS